MNTTLIIKEIKKHLGIKRDGEFAEYLGIKPNSISTWKARNTLDYALIIAKCEDIDANWLFSGEGVMLKSPGIDQLNFENLIKIIAEKDETISALKKTIESQEELLTFYRERTNKPAEKSSRRAG